MQLVNGTYREGTLAHTEDTRWVKVNETRQVLTAEAQEKYKGQVMFAADPADYEEATYEYQVNVEHILWWRLA